MNSRLAIGGFAILCAIVGLNVSGFCYREFRYLSSEELFRVAVQSQAGRLEGMPDDPSLQAAYAAEFVAAHPDCCSIDRSSPFGSSVFADLFGFKLFLVRVQYRLSSAQVAAAPRDGQFYEALVEVTPCGRAGHSIGQRLEKLPESSTRRRVQGGCNAERL